VIGPLREPVAVLRPSSLSRSRPRTSYKSGLSPAPARPHTAPLIGDCSWGSKAYRSHDSIKTVTTRWRHKSCGIEDTTGSPLLYLRHPDVDHSLTIPVKFTRPQSVPPAMRSNPASHGPEKQTCQQKRQNREEAKKEALKKERLRLVGEKVAWFKTAEVRQRRVRVTKRAAKEAELKEVARVLAVQERAARENAAQERSTQRNADAEENERLREAQLKHAKKCVAEYESQFVGDTLAEDKRMTDFEKTAWFRGTVEESARARALADQAASDAIKHSQEARVNAVHEEEERQAAEKAYEASQARKKAAEEEAAEEAEAVYLAKQELMRGRASFVNKQHKT